MKSHSELTKRQLQVASLHLSLAMKKNKMLQVSIEAIISRELFGKAQNILARILEKNAS